MNKDEEEVHSISLGMNDPAKGQTVEFERNVRKPKEFSDYCEEYKELIKDFDPYEDRRKEGPPFVLEDHTKSEIIQIMKDMNNRSWLGMRCEISSLRKQIRKLREQRKL